MNQKYSSNNDENDDANQNTDEIHYFNLITKLKEISKTIILLEKTIFK
tara:strand:+ start:449 stop:592 length:144 start_codon:yes stop_codon:yes gene_type:complete